MDITQSLTMETLNSPVSGMPLKTISARKLAKRIFELAAQAGRPYNGITSKKWARKWLASDEFVLMEIETSRVAMPLSPKNPSLVLQQVTAAAQEPIVVDLNKRHIGTAFIGYVPEVIIVDGKHRYAAGTLRGDIRTQAWVGVKAVDKVSPKVRTLVASKSKTRTGTKIEAAAAMAAIPAGAIQRQDREQGNSAPHAAMPGQKGYKMYNTGGPGASLGSGSGSNPNRMGFGAVEQDPSDEKEDPSDQAPGAGVGKRLAPSPGGSTSEMRGKLKASDYVGTLRTKKPKGRK